MFHCGAYFHIAAARKTGSGVKLIAFLACVQSGFVQILAASVFRSDDVDMFAYHVAIGFFAHIRNKASSADFLIFAHNLIAGKFSDKPIKR